MKKLFMALMAVLMFASCGNGDSGNGSSSSGTVVDKLISYSVAYRNEIKAAIENDDTEKFVLASEKFADKMRGIKKALEKVDKNKIPAAKMKKCENVLNEVWEQLNYADEYMQFSEFQQERMMRVFENLDF